MVKEEYDTWSWSRRPSTWSFSLTCCSPPPREKEAACLEVLTSFEDCHVGRLWKCHHYWHFRNLEKRPSLWFFQWRWEVIFNLYLMASIRLSIGVAVTRSAPSFRSPAWTVNSKHKSSNRSQHNRSRTLLQKYHEYFCNRNYSNHHPVALLDRVVEYQLWSN